MSFISNFNATICIKQITTKFNEKKIREKIYNLFLKIGKIKGYKFYGKYAFSEYTNPDSANNAIRCV